MNITDIKIRRLLHEGRLRAIVSVTVDDEIAIHDIKVIEGDRLFVAMPSRKEQNGIFRDIAHPISPAARRQFEDAVLDAYQRELARQSVASLDYGEHPAVVASTGGGFFQS